MDVQWLIASGREAAQVVGRGTVQAVPDKDFTVKVDAGSAARPDLLLRVHGRRRAIADRTHEDRA
jgi:hypothetical protein